MSPRQMSPRQMVQINICFYSSVWTLSIHFHNFDPPGQIITQKLTGCGSMLGLVVGSILQRRYKSQSVTATIKAYRNHFGAIRDAVLVCKVARGKNIAGLAALPFLV